MAQSACMYAVADHACTQLMSCMLSIGSKRLTPMHPCCDVPCRAAHFHDELRIDQRSPRRWNSYVYTYVARDTRGPGNLHYTICACMCTCVPAYIAIYNTCACICMQPPSHDHAATHTNWMHTCTGPMHASLLHWTTVSCMTALNVSFEFVFCPPPLSFFVNHPSCLTQFYNYYSTILH